MAVGKPVRRVSRPRSLVITTSPPANTRPSMESGLVSIMSPEERRSISRRESSFQDRSVMAWIFSPGLPSTGTTSPISA
jgi:hypothetical protein